MRTALQKKDDFTIARDNFVNNNIKANSIIKKKMVLVNNTKTYLMSQNLFYKDIYGAVWNILVSCE